MDAFPAHLVVCLFHEPVPDPLTLMLRRVQLGWVLLTPDLNFRRLRLQQRDLSATVVKVIERRSNSRSE
jgi:hypothetical protein